MSTVIFFFDCDKSRDPTVKSLNRCRPPKIVSEGTLQNTLKPTEACMEEIRKKKTFIPSPRLMQIHVVQKSTTS